MINPDHFRDVVTIPLDDGLVLSKGDGRLFLLNFSGRIVWEGLTKGLTPQEVAADLADSFQIPMQTAERDVSRAVAQWRSEGLLGRDQSPETSDTWPSPSHEPFYPEAEPERAYVYNVLDRMIGFRFQTGDLETLIDPLLAHARVPDDETPEVLFDLYQTTDEFILMIDGRTVAREGTPFEMRAVTLLELLSAFHPHREWIALFHAAVVGMAEDPRGCIVLSAGGGSGKTTLAAALARSGFQYMSDDTTGLDRDRLEIAAAPFALSVKEGGWEAISGLYPGIADLPVIDEHGLKIRYLPPPTPDGRIRAGLPARLIIFPDYRPGSTASMQAISGLEALERLVGSGAWISPEPDDVGLVIDWIKKTPAFEMTYDSLDEAVAMVREVWSQ